MDAPDQTDATPDHATPDESAEPRFPVIVLAAPGFVFGLFVIMAHRLVPTLQSVRMAMIVALASAAASIACFAIIAAKSPEQHVRVGFALAIGAVVFALGAAILRLT